MAAGDEEQIRESKRWYLDRLDKRLFTGNGSILDWGNGSGEK